MGFFYSASEVFDGWSDFSGVGKGGACAAPDCFGIAPANAFGGFAIALVEVAYLREQGLEDITLSVSAGDQPQLVDHRLKGGIVAGACGEAGGEGAFAGGFKSGTVGDGKVFGEAGFEGKLAGHSGEEAVNCAEAESSEMMDDVGEQSAAIFGRECFYSGVFGEGSELFRVFGCLGNSFE